MTVLLSVRLNPLPWQEALFRFLTDNSAATSDRFLIPATRIAEMGTHIKF